ncbi:MAG: flagellar basal-body MS-ring/collar protein FliF [Nitrosomonas sp.]|uniref:flagellar basal-body MS-ring/collar protein FliF n=1 Tax=Nitrosomonas sp. TaxID=42353 RepID=UPI0027326226|nr:flagellar basal-body MS-ring/collar protein FliF [Nitrosomonas sp.]MDP3663986.1 flagellar basal-body MS-ring/collar protein FliF [Nitrosomonas sp.]MDZ4106107.1 flagellar basal-body MS-ring/collar protein FliF [Nitrosomonas sp.]
MATVPSESNATAPPTTIRLAQFNQLSNQKKLGLILSAAAVIALLVGALMWSQAPDYRVLYNNVSDQDGAAIITALQQMNVPYKFSESGSGVILIPEKQVHEIRLRLAGQGLPKGGLPGFELMENQKFGSSQFLEQVNYQRALEGELARSVQSLSAVQSARVHLAIAKPSVFSREKQQPSVSVLLNLYPGRVLGAEQVSAIVHLMSSSVPSLPVKNVTVVDQNGNLLSTQNDGKQDSRFDAKQLEYIQELEENYIRRIEAILTPITGAANVRAQVTADMDFSRVERAEEIYRPNNTESEAAAIRSQQTLEATSTGAKLDGGIPGALTNRPPEPAAAPIEAGGENQEEGNKTPPVPTDQKKESTINYEVDKTVQHTQQSTGNIKRLSAAVVVNYRKKVDENGEVTYEPLTAEEIKEINSLVREAMGYSEKRGDSLTVTNGLFTADTATILDIPLWKDPDVIMLAKEIGKQLLIAAVVLFFLLKILRPFLKSLTQPPPPPPVEPEKLSGEAALGQLSEHGDGTALQAIQKSIFDENLKKAKQLAVDEPAIVANVVKEWISKNG